jgi:hypothetical protein
MSSAKRSVGVVVSAFLVMSLAVLWTSSANAQSDSFLGTWVLNVAKSKYSPGPPPKEQTVVYEASGKGYRVTAKGTDATGKPINSTLMYMFDGQDHPITGNADADAQSAKRIDAYTIEFTRKKAGKVMVTGTNAVSKDGKTRTITTTGTNAQGQKVNSVSVYEKK